MPSDLLQVLERAAKIAPENGSVFYDEEHPIQPLYISYPDLVKTAKTNAQTLLDKNIVAKGETVLLHFNRHIDYVVWYWSILYTGAVPTISTPLAVDLIARKRHLVHLQTLLNHPRILTSQVLQHELAGAPDLDIVLVESIPDIVQCKSPKGVDGTSYTCVFSNGIQSSTDAKNTELAFLMLTSGSTGHAKAVEEHHDRVIAAIEGKATEFGTTKNDIFLNWIGFDHVACVTEMHLHAMRVGALDIHISASILLQDPLLWLQLVEKHGVTHSFAPNFFVGALNAAIDKASPKPTYDVSTIRNVVSGGEANVTTTGITFNNYMHSMGASNRVLVPAFGMTETCGGSTYHRQFPILERVNNMQFCSVGKNTNALKYRVTDDEGNVLGAEQEGNLELSGPCVFPAYFNDKKNTEESFTDDGWFKAGDKASITTSGALNLSGRVKDSIIINGVKYFSHELESALEEAKLDGIVPSFTASFSTQPVGSDSEELVIVFLPTDAAVRDQKILATALEYMTKTAVLYCNKRPLDIIPLPREFLPKSALGKLSRPKLKKAYEAGEFNSFKEETQQRIAVYRSRRRTPPTTEMEKQLVELFAEEFNLDKEVVGIDDSLLDVGIDSLALFRFKGLLQKLLGIPDISMTVLLMNPSMKGLAAAVEKLKAEPAAYNPVVVMQTGNAPVPPIWFFHPGLGEVLVFLNLSKYFSDRKVYGLRAPGFNPHEERFKNLDQMVDTYVAAIRKQQPQGPYCLLGYSYGGLTTYNAAKRLEAMGETVQFCGIMNLPPHVKHHMQQMDWTELFLTLLSFMGFITEKQAFEWTEPYRLLPKQEVVDKVMAVIDHKRLDDLDLDGPKLDWWAGVADSVQSLARDYDPSGSVASLDVFYAIPIYRVSAIGDKKSWFENEVSKWFEFSRSPVRYHESPGTHHSMIDPENVFVFQKILKAAMKERGVA